MNRSRARPPLRSVLLAALAIAGCSSESSDSGNQPTADAAASASDAAPNPLNQQACTSLQSGSVTMVMGQDPFSMNAPAISGGQQVNRVSIPPRAAGHVTYTAPTSGEYIFYTSVDVPLAVFAEDGQLIDVKALRLRIPECTQVNGRHTVDLQAGKYVIRLGPDQATSVDVVVVAPAS